MAAVIGSVAAVNDFLESDEDDDLEDLIVFQHPTKYLKQIKMIFEKSCPLRFL